MIKEENWSLVVESRSGHLKLNFRQLWEYRDLIRMFVRRDFVAMYKQTVLGPLWYIIQPILTAVTYSLIFSKFAGMQTDGVPAILFYLSGITIWNYFSECLQKTSNTFITNASIFGKVYFPRLAVPISIVISNFITFAIQFSVFLAILFYYSFTQGYNVQLSYVLVILPVLLLIMSGLGLGFGIIVSALTTRYRDLRFLVSFGVQLMMFVTPVIYSTTSLKMSDAYVNKLFYLNPLAPVLEAFRYGFFGSGHFSPAHILYSFGFMCVVLLTGIFMFNRIERSFMDTV